MPSPFKFSAFNAGQRACLGQKMALAEAAYVLATVYGGFELELSPAEQAAPDGVPTLDSLTLPQKKGVTVRVKRRV
jgi:cytochrome P450